MRWMKTCSLVAVASLTVVGCGGDDDDGGAAVEPSATMPATSSPPADPATTSTTAAPTGVAMTAPASSAEPSLAEGIYRTAELTREQLVATVLDAGFDPSAVETDLGWLQERIVVGLRLADGSWTLLLAIDGAPEQPDWRGTYEVVDDNTVVATDPCGEITYTYRIEGEELRLDMRHSECAAAGEADLINQTALLETAAFIRVPDGAEVEQGEPSTYAGRSFVVPFEVTLPPWLPAEPSTESSTFVTWEAAEVDRAVRILAPVNLYPPGSATPAPLPDDYVAYLLGLDAQGVVFDDIVETTVDGMPATVATVTTPVSVDGALGCPDKGMTAYDCFGPQPELVLRLAAIEAPGQTVLVWVRDNSGDGSRDIDYGSFEAMLASIRFI